MRDKYEVYPKKRENMRTYRMSDPELALFLSTMAKRGFMYETQYIRFLARRDGELIGEPALLQAVINEHPLQTSLEDDCPPRSWTIVREQIIGMVRADIAAGNCPPAWAFALMGETPVIEAAPMLCCREPNPEFVGISIVCANCESSLPPAAAAQAAQWQAKKAAAHANHELRVMYERLAKRLQNWAAREEQEPELRALRHRFERPVPPVPPVPPILQTRSANDRGDTMPPESGPASSTNPKPLIRRAAKMRGDKTIAHILGAVPKTSLCGVHVTEKNLEPGEGIECIRCAAYSTSMRVGTAA